jgi:molybdopterin converting factor small subunit
MAVRNSTIVKSDDLVEDGDVIAIFPAISGG